MRAPLQAMNTDTPAAFVLLRALDAGRGEAVNAGVILFAPAGPMVAMAPTNARIRALHPDFAALPLKLWGERLQEALRKTANGGADVKQQLALLALYCQPFSPSPEPGVTMLSGDNAADALASLLEWQVAARAATLRPSRTAKRQSKLTTQLRAWFRAAKVFSSNSGDLSKGRIVANFPVAASDDLYADFAVKNGALHVIETLDLRGVNHLTPMMRGDAAVKAITLDEARQAVDGSRIAVVSASDFAIARPAIKMLERYASDLYVLESPADKSAFVKFLHHTLHSNSLPDLQLDQL
jgi:hypothetical protein